MKKIILIIAALLALGTSEAQYRILVSFDSANGAYPYGDLTLSNGILYGMTSERGTSDFSNGNIFSVDTNGRGFTTMLNFNDSDGAAPFGSLTLSGNVLFGVTSIGGANGFGDGCVFKINTNGSGFKSLLVLNGRNYPYGSNAVGRPVLSGGVLFCMTSTGGANDDGCIFKVDTDGNAYRDLWDFGSSIYGPTGSLVISGNKLYGMAPNGGVYHDGGIFSIDTNGSGYTELLDFNGTDGLGPQGSLLLSGSWLYGMTEYGGTGSGVIFSIDTNGTGYTDLHNFGAEYNGGGPFGTLTRSGNLLYGMSTSNIFLMDTDGGGYKTLLLFDNTNGANPLGDLTILGNVLYGMTLEGGAFGEGVVFSYVPCTFPVTVSGTLSCSGGSNGTATAYPSGGTPPYSYIWINTSGQYTATATGLSAGTYTVTVSDSNACTGTASVTITQPPLLQDSINSQCATCCNCKGTTHVYVWGGTPPYTYSWSNGRTNDTMMGLASGTYTATVWDSNRCMITDSIFVHEGPSISKYQTNENCYGDANGSATITVDGNYSYSWNPGGETTASINGLSAGAYNVTITNNDTAGCSVTYSFSITQPDSLFLADGFGVNGFISCADTDCIPLFFQAYGGTPPYTYINLIPPIWMLCNSGGISGTVIDANGCSASIPNGTGVEFGLSIRVEINNNAGCNGENYGNATVSIHTGSWSTYAYSWNPGGGTNQTETSLSAGTYTVTVTAINPNCATSAIIAISQSPAIILTADTINASPGNCNGSAWATASGGVAPYTYSWNPGGLTSDTITNQCAGAYCCTITDANGCIDSICTNIETSTGTNQLTMENGQLTIYPNPGDGKFTIQLSVVSHQSSVEVYNVLGEKVYSELSIVHFPLSMDLSSQPDGVYFYRVLYEDGGLIGEGKIIIER